MFTKVVIIQEKAKIWDFIGKVYIFHPSTRFPDGYVLDLCLPFNHPSFYYV